MSSFVNLIGQKFGRLVVVEQSHKNKWNHYYWLCLCDCGKEKIIAGSSLKTKCTQSCGCLRKEKVTKHGYGKKKKRTKTYHTWQHMIQRCTNSNYQYYAHYGGRGITVCERWKNSFENFLNDMGKPPTKNHSIDRIDNNLGYFLGNCRWTTKSQQQRNKRNNCLITHDGRTLCLINWSEETGIQYATLWARIFKYRWEITKVLTTPVLERGKDAR